VAEPEDIGRRDPTLGLGPLDRPETSGEGRGRHQERGGKGVGEPLPVVGATARFGDRHLGPEAIGQEVGILVRQRPAPPLLRVVGVNRDAAAQLLVVDEHAGDAAVPHRHREDAQPDVGFEQAPKVAERCVAQPEPVALGGGDFLPGLAGRRAQDVVRPGVSPGKG
jgi:hypothetical protein